MNISVIIATYNRSSELRKTLEALLSTRRDGLSLNIIIVDNGSTDNTMDVVHAFMHQLDVIYLFDPIRGKSHALNFAIDHSSLGDIIVFTDDDVEPSIDWLIEICASCQRWPYHLVFGGRINAIFPFSTVPQWASKQDPFINSFAFAVHHVAQKDCIYSPKQQPFGPNFWLRKEILDKGYRFDERIGPGTGIMSEDTLFLLRLARDGYSIIYAPKAVVGHRIRPELLKLTNILSRAFSFGRSHPYLFGISKYDLYQNNKLLWYFYIFAAVFWNLLKIPVSFLFFHPNSVSQIAKYISYAALHIESFLIAIKSKAPFKLIPP